ALPVRNITRPRIRIRAHCRRTWWNVIFTPCSGTASWAKTGTHLAARNTMIYRITKFTWPLVCLALIAVGCGGGGVLQPISTPDAPTQSSVPYTHYVTNNLTIGSTPAEALALAFDLDNDPQHRPDNALGGILVGLNIALGVDINSALDGALTAG